MEPWYDWPGRYQEKHDVDGKRVHITTRFKVHLSRRSIARRSRVRLILTLMYHLLGFTPQTVILGSSRSPNYRTRPYSTLSTYDTVRTFSQLFPCRALSLSRLQKLGPKDMPQFMDSAFGRSGEWFILCCIDLCGWSRHCHSYLRWATLFSFLRVAAGTPAFLALFLSFLFLDCGFWQYSWKHPRSFLLCIQLTYPWISSTSILAKQQYYTSLATTLYIQTEILTFVYPNNHKPFYTIWAIGSVRYSRFHSSISFFSSSSSPTTPRISGSSEPSCSISSSCIRNEAPRFPISELETNIGSGNVDFGLSIWGLPARLRLRTRRPVRMDSTLKFGELLALTCREGYCTHTTSIIGRAHATFIGSWE